MDTCWRCRGPLTPAKPIPITHFGKGVYALDSVEAAKCADDTCRESRGYSHSWLAMGRLADLADGVPERPFFARVNRETRTWHQVEAPAGSKRILATTNPRERDDIAREAASIGDFTVVPGVLHLCTLPETFGQRGVMLAAVHAVFERGLPEPQSPNEFVSGFWEALVEVVCNDSYEAATPAAEILVMTTVPQPLRPRLQGALEQADPRHWRAEVLAELLSRTPVREIRDED